MASIVAATPQLVVLGAIQDTGSGRTAELVSLAVYGDAIAAQTASVPQLLALAVIEEHPTPDSIPNIEQYIALAVYGEGAPEDYRLRAWGFTLDGHRFYVLHLGEEGTFVYDFTTKQWAEWKSEGFETGWNAYVGRNWGSEDRIIAADRQNPTVWIIDPDTFTDEGYKDIRRTVTGIIPHSGFGWLTHNSLQLMASVGDPSATEPTIELTFSDDQGQTWDAPADSLIALVPGENGQQLDWQSLGSFQAPGRVINITDWGGVGRIDRAAVELD